MVVQAFGAYDKGSKSKDSKATVSMTFKVSLVAMDCMLLGEPPSTLARTGSIMT